MTWLYLRRSKITRKWYVGKTGKSNYHDRDSGSFGEFAVDMSGKELAVQVPDNYSHEDESAAIQFVAAMVGRQNVSNSKQLDKPETGRQWDYSRPRPSFKNRWWSK